MELEDTENSKEDISETMIDILNTNLNKNIEIWEKDNDTLFIRFEGLNKVFTLGKVRRFWNGCESGCLYPSCINKKIYADLVGDININLMRNINEEYILEENIEVVYLKLSNEIIFAAKKEEGPSYCRNNKEGKKKIACGKRYLSGRAKSFGVPNSESLSG